MKYIKDPDLDFLKECSSTELNIVVDVLLHDNRRQPRSLIQLASHPLYKQHTPNHAAYWELIAGEIQKYGSNPLAALARAGRGKPYLKILGDVCDRLNVRYMSASSVDLIERELCLGLFKRAIQSMSLQQLQNIPETLGLTPEKADHNGIIQDLIEKMRLDDVLTSYLTMIIAHGAAMHASAASYHDVSPSTFHGLLDAFAAPLSAELEKISPLSLTGSAHWIIIPAVLQIAYLRAKKNAEKTL